MKRTKLFIGLAMLLAGCCPPKTEDYAGRKPEMDIRDYFDGQVIADGVYMDRSGMVQEQFHVVMDCSWDGDVGTLKEHFVYMDGRKDQRVWTITMADDHHFKGTAHDVVGEAKGEQYGNASDMKYVLRVPVKDTTYDISMDDWIYRLSEKTALNHVEMRKFGIKVGDLFITFRKKS